MKNENVKEKSWDEFRNTGLLLYINQILHVFGWAIVVDIDENNETINTYPARVKFRGFGAKNVTDSYIKISKYMKENAEVLLKESEE